MMGKIIRLFAILLFCGISTSCSRDEMLYGDYFSALYYRVEDESGNDIMRDLKFYLGDGVWPDVPSFSAKWIIDSDDDICVEDTGHRSIPIYLKLDDTYSYLQAAWHPIKISMHLFEDDTEKIELYGQPTKYKDNIEYEWEYKGTKLPMSESGPTYVTFVRHNDGTYTLK